MAGAGTTGTAELARQLDGRLIAPGQDGFDEARSLWNVRFDRKPDLIAHCLSAGDVQATIGFAREQERRLSVKSGGHSYAARSVADGGVLIDLSAMKTLEVDATGKSATIGPGVTCAELDAATQAHGLATPTPTVSSVGVIGAALGGGSGYLARRFGLTLDNVTAAEVVTADGRLLRASADEHPDLFWAIRGGGGNFGVVTSMQLSLHEVGPQVLSGQVIYRFDDAADYLRAYRDFVHEAPDELQSYAFCFRAPPIDLFPAELHGQPLLDFVLCHQDAEAADVVRPLRELGTPVLDAVGPTPYVKTQAAFDANLPAGQRYLSKAHDLDTLSDGAIDTMVEHVNRMVGPFTAAYFDPLGGAISRVATGATAYAGRASRYGFHIIAGWTDAEEDAAVVGWASGFAAAMAHHANGGVYVNLIADDEVGRVPAAYGRNLPRLRELKRIWDPENLFQSNQNIEPARQAES
jgi:FAD/FMN-containing dehydrogenase